MAISRELGSRIAALARGLVLEQRAQEGPEVLAILSITASWGCFPYLALSRPQSGYWSMPRMRSTVSDGNLVRSMARSLPAGRCCGMGWLRLSAIVTG
jgi:hypothetical protein